MPVFDPSEKKQVRSRCRSYIFSTGLAVYLHHVIEYHSAGSLVDSVPLKTRCLPNMAHVRAFTSVHCKVYAHHPY